MLSVRLDAEFESLLNHLSKTKGLSKSMIIKEALSMYFQKENKSLSPYELGADLFGQEGGDPNAAASYKTRLKEKLRGKHSH